MTFAALLADTYRRCGYTNPPSSSEVIARLKQFINESHEAILSEPALTSCLYGTLTFASVASQARYGLSNVAQIRAVTEQTNDTKLTRKSLSWYRLVDPNPPVNEAPPAWYVPVGSVAVAQVPATTGTGLWVVSSSASDTAPTVAIEGVRVGGYPHTPANVTLTGTTRAQVGGGSGLTDYIDVTQFALSAACVGDVSLYDAASGGNLLGVIPRGQTTARYYGFYLALTPSDAITYTVDVEHEVITLSADTDEPQIPVRFHRLLAMGARAKEYEKTENSRYAVAMSEYDKGLKQLIYAVSCGPEMVTVPGGSVDEAGSNLGPWYPAGIW